MQGDNKKTTTWLFIGKVFHLIVLVDLHTVIQNSLVESALKENIVTSWGWAVPSSGQALLVSLLTYPNIQTITLAWDWFTLD